MSNWISVVVILGLIAVGFTVIRALNQARAEGREGGHRLGQRLAGLTSGRAARRRKAAR